MTWWYENEEKKMEFDKSRIYSAVNADELHAGDKVIVGSSLLELKTNVECNRRCGNIVEIGGECSNRRFTVDDVDGRGQTYWELAYLVERRENCLKCKKCEVISDKSMHCDWVGTGSITSARVEKCNHYEPKTGQKEMCLNCKHYNKVNDFRDCTLVNNPTGSCPHYEAEKHYRPFKDTDELIKVWDAKIGTPKWGTDGDLTMPHIWVRHKATKRTDLIVALTYTSYATVYAEGNLENLFNIYEFLDGSPCGVEE